MCTTGIRGRRAAQGLLAIGVALAVAPTARGATLPPPLGCVSISDDPEQTQNYAPLQGTSDLNAQTGNTRLVAGLTREGTMTVLRWPTPSSYDQIKHFSPDANLPRAGADANMGAFLGVVVGGRTVWLRDLPTQQRFAPGDSDTIITTHRGDGWAATVTTVVAPDRDVLAQHVAVSAPNGGGPTALVAFENLSLAVMNVPGVPYGDWCWETLDVDRARWLAGAGAIVHSRTGIDPSRNGAKQSVAIAMGLGGAPDGHQVGGDAHELDGLLAPQDAYADAADGRLSGADGWTGNTTGALSRTLTYRDGTAEEDVYLAAAHTAPDATALLQDARRDGSAALAAAKGRWLRTQLADAAMPRTRDARMLAMARRALILLATTQAQSGAIVASITTQPVYAADWPRDGAYLTEAMERGGLHEGAGRHGRFLARTQARPGYSPPGAPLAPVGAWPMNMLDTGAAGGPIPYEFDEVGFGVWSMWRHYAFTRDRAYLEDVWPAIRRSAELLVSCRDPGNGLQCSNTEDDNLALFQQQTIGAAMTTYAGLGAGMQAARVLGHTADADRYAARRGELVRAIEAHLWDEPTGHYSGQQALLVRKVATYLFWPEIPSGLDPARMARHADWTWAQFSPSFDAPRAGGRTFGFYDGLAILGLARWWRAHDPARLADLRRGLRWIAHVQATAGTGLIGENWRVRDGRVQTMTAVPQLWEHSLFYLASLAVYGSRPAR